MITAPSRLRMPHYCIPPRLKFIREDSDHIVYAQSPEYINPSVLSDSLVKNYGENHFQISLRRGVMVIYIDREEVRRREREQATKCDSEVAIEKEVETREQGSETEKMETYKRRSLDVKLAQKALREDWWR